MQVKGRPCEVCGRPIKVSSLSLVVEGHAFHSHCYLRHRAVKCPRCGYRDRVHKGSLVVNPLWKCPQCGVVVNTKP